MASSKRVCEMNHDGVQLAVGATGIGIGLIDHIVHWAQVVSIVGGAIIVIITLSGMIAKAWKRLRE
jgi:hypothetical protein